ncbi:Uncharacterised protein [Mycobacterium tuberculosis]|nr:Uncharacterised protein [Mycobacterium tuberculosis]
MSFSRHAERGCRTSRARASRRAARVAGRGSRLLVRPAGLGSAGGAWFGRRGLVRPAGVGGTRRPGNVRGSAASGRCMNGPIFPVGGRRRVTYLCPEVSCAFVIRCETLRELSGRTRRWRSCAGQSAGRSDRAAHADRGAAPADARGQGHRTGGGGRCDPLLGVQDEPARVGAARLQSAGRPGSTRPLRRPRRGRARELPRTRPGGEEARLVAGLRRRRAELVRAVPRAGAVGDDDPQLRGPVHSRPVTDARLRAGRHPAGTP